jgi:hypothetical protein
MGCHIVFLPKLSKSPDAAPDMLLCNLLSVYFSFLFFFLPKKIKNKRGCYLILWPLNAIV